VAVNPLVIGLTMARRGLLAPAPPLRQLAQLNALRIWRYGLAGEVRQAAGRSPHGIAVIDEDRGEFTYAALVAEGDRVAAWLAAKGLGPGDKVGLLARNHVGAVAFMLGASTRGVDLVLVNTGLAAEPLAAVVEREGIRALVHDDEFEDALAALGSALPMWSESTLLRELRALGPVATPTPPEQGGRTIILTSGTTGVPRGATRTAPGGVGAMVSIIERIPLHAKDRVLVSAPLFHTWGYAALQITVGIRGTLVLQRRFDPAAAREALADHRCAAMFAVPVMLQRMMELPADLEGRAARSRLRVVATSGSAYPSGFPTRFMDEYGDILYNLYGSTEASWICIATPADLRRDPETAGTPPVGTRVEVLDDALRPVADGEVGRIFVGNDLVFDGYTSGESKEFHEGMVSTGDLGHVRDGLFFVDGRDDDMIVSGGENVYPGEVEAALARHDAVREVAVVGVPDPAYGQRLVAFVALRDGEALTEDEVKDLVKATVSRHTVPREVHFVEELPRNATGKVLARELRARVAP